MRHSRCCLTYLDLHHASEERRPRVLQELHPAELTANEMQAEVAPQDPRELRSPETEAWSPDLVVGSEASTRCATAEKATVVPPKVWARVRPPIEQDHGPCHAVDCIDKTVRVRNDVDTVERMLAGQAETSPSEPREFAFDGVFGESSAQRDVFMQIGLPVLREALRGINGTILAYGQTGSGKTHSLLHQSAKGEEAGLLPRLVASLFLMISQDVANVYDVEAAAVQL
eukprot:g30257.t1